MMPPPPALRSSPRREHRMENIHKRGCSFESGLPPKAIDDDLALFNDMENRERDNFLLHTSNDFDDPLSKLRYFSDFKLRVTIPIRGESSDLLNADVEKNDYDWLKTPPDTPLFSFLDDNEPQQSNLPPRGRPLSQPINISRSSSLTEKIDRTSRNSASPNRRSPSPRFINKLAPLRGRPSSAPRSSSPSVLRPTMPSPRPSTSLNKPSRPSPRSLTPTFRRLSTGSNGQISSSGRRGASPIKTSRGNSASPKIRGWQSNIHGFPLDAPPNLRTSLSDRPASNMRGLSPVSRNGRGRQSMSPTASRSTRTSHSQERNCFISYTKASAGSSRDDDVDSLHSVTSGISSSPAARGASMNNRAMALSKKPPRTFSASSTPKRCFDLVLWQMGHRKTQNMFRPLLSSVPATNFYVGKGKNVHRPLFSRNSSLTTSTSASSEQGASVALDMEVSEKDQNELVGEWESMQDPDIQEEVFIFDKGDEIKENGGLELFAGNSLCGNGSFDEGLMTNKIDSQEFENSRGNFGDAASTATASEFSYVAGDHSEVDGWEILVICSKCGQHFCFEGVSGDRDICQECLKKDRSFAIREPVIPLPVNQDETAQFEITCGMDSLCNEVLLNVDVPKLPEKSSSEIMLGRHERNSEEGLDYLMNSDPVQLVVDQRELNLSDQWLNIQQEVCATQSDSGNEFQQTQHTVCPDCMVGKSEGTGISVILVPRSSSSEWPVVQARASSATDIICSQPSYARDDTTSTKCSIGLGNVSVCSSVDLGPSRPTESHDQEQLTSRKNDMDSLTNDNDAKAQCNDLHRNAASLNGYKLLLDSSCEIEEKFNSFIERVDHEALRQEKMLVSEEHDNSLDLADLITTQLSSLRPDFVVGDVYVHPDTCMVMNTSGSQLLSHQEILLNETAPAGDLSDEGCSSCINADECLFKSNERSGNIEVPTVILDSSVVEEDSVLNGIACRSDISDSVTSSSSVVILELQNDQDNLQCPQTECSPSHMPTSLEAFHESSVSITSDEDVFIYTLESDIDLADGIQEESTAAVEVPRRHTSRSLTLEEATDTILFCSSIIHDIAYKAASIGMEEELMLPETSHQTVMILGKSVSDKKDSRKMSRKHEPKSLKFKRKRLETQTKLPSTELGNHSKVQHSRPSNAVVPNKGVDSTKPPKLESKCNCTVM